MGDKNITITVVLFIILIVIMLIAGIIIFYNINNLKSTIITGQGLYNFDLANKTTTLETSGNITFVLKNNEYVYFPYIIPTSNITRNFIFGAGAIPGTILTIYSYGSSLLTVNVSSVRQDGTSPYNSDGTSNTGGTGTISPSLYKKLNGEDFQYTLSNNSMLTYQFTVLPNNVITETHSPSSF